MQADARGDHGGSGNSRPLSAQDWCMAALAVMGERGVDQLKVESLAKGLGVTKGSFYWHFEDRAALISAALAVWEKEATTSVIEQFGTIADPVERLHTLLSVSLGDAAHGPLDASLMARTDDPVVGTVVRRVAHTRVAFLEKIFGEIGMSPGDARARALATYSAYVGHFHLRRSLPGERDLEKPSADYLRHLVAVFTTS